MLDYFDAYLLGLTATPAKHTYGFFNQNVVMEYPHERAVADGVNCDYEVYRIRTSITAAGSTIEAVPGLAYKYFTIADDAKFGGIYLWSSRAQAKAWFNEAWHARVLAQRGAAAQVTMFDAPLVLDNGTPVGTDGDAAAAIVRIRIPTGVSRDTLIAEFNKSAPFYRSVSGLARKYFLITDDGQFGGVYLWKSRDAGQAFFDAAWRDRVLKTYGSPAQLDWFDAPVILPSKLPAAVP